MAQMLEKLNLVSAVIIMARDSMMLSLEKNINWKTF